MKKLGLILVAAMLVSCAGQKPAVNQAENPYANRPDLLAEQQILVAIDNLDTDIRKQCQLAMSLAEDEKDPRTVENLKQAAYLFCAGRFEDLSALAGKSVPKLHGDYREAAVLYRRAALLTTEAFRSIADCFMLPVGKRAACDEVAGKKLLLAMVVTRAAFAAYKKLTPASDGSRVRRPQCAPRISLVFAPASQPASAPVKVEVKKPSPDFQKRMAEADKTCSEGLLKTREEQDLKKRFEKMSAALVVCEGEYRAVGKVATEAKQGAWGNKLLAARAYEKAAGAYAELAGVLRGCLKGEGAKYHLDECAEDAKEREIEALKIEEFADEQLLKSGSAKK